MVICLLERLSLVHLILSYVYRWSSEASNFLPPLLYSISVNLVQLYPSIFSLSYQPGSQSLSAGRHVLIWLPPRTILIDNEAMHLPEDLKIGSISSLCHQKSILHTQVSMHRLVAPCPGTQTQRSYFPKIHAR